MTLKPEARTGPEPHFLQKHAAGLIALVTGVAAFIVCAATQAEFWSQPDLRLSAPFLVAAVAAGAVSMARREGALYLPLLGIGMAAAAMVLGLVIVFGIVILATAIVIVILHGVM